MSLSIIFFIFFIFLCGFFLFFYTFSSSLKLLILTEFFWITLYFLALYLSFYLNNYYLITLILFFLCFSSAEISIAFILFSLQTQLYSSDLLYLWNHKFANLKSIYKSV